MKPALTALKDTLVRLHRSGLRCGLPDAAARRLVDALARGAGISEAAAASGLDPHLAQIIAHSEVADVPTVLGRLAVAGSQLDMHTRRLRSAGVYPLVLACSITIASVLTFGVMRASLGQLMEPAASASSPLLMGAVGLAVAMLLILSVLVLGRVRIPGLSSGWAALDAHVFLEGLLILSDAGVALPAGLRAAAVWCSPAARAAAEGMARALEAGTTEADARPLLQPFERAVLLGAAASGAQVETTGALAAQHRTAISRRLSAAVIRIELTGLCLAGLALLGLGASYYLVYVDVLAR